MIAGKDAPTFGEAKNSWLTGTAAWNYYAIVQWILGMRTSLDGLEIAPVIPKKLAGIHGHAHFRGVVYKISIERKGEGNQLRSRWMVSRSRGMLCLRLRMGERKL
jgi:cellobiose phosphorylase